MMVVTAVVQRGHNELILGRSALFRQSNSTVVATVEIRTSAIGLFRACWHALTQRANS
jgi:hypothetical protein